MPGHIAGPRRYSGGQLAGSLIYDILAGWRIVYYYCTAIGHLRPAAFVCRYCIIQAVLFYSTRVNYAAIFVYFRRYLPCCFLSPFDIRQQLSAPPGQPLSLFRVLFIRIRLAQPFSASLAISSRRLRRAPRRFRAAGVSAARRRFRFASLPASGLYSRHRIFPLCRYSASSFSIICIGNN